MTLALGISLLGGTAAYMQYQGFFGQPSNSEDADIYSTNEVSSIDFGSSKSSPPAPETVERLPLPDLKIDFVEKISGVSSDSSWDAASLPHSFRYGEVYRHESDLFFPGEGSWIRIDTKSKIWTNLKGFRPIIQCGTDIWLGSVAERSKVARYDLKTRQIILFESKPLEAANVLPSDQFWFGSCTTVGAWISSSRLSDSDRILYLDAIKNQADIFRINYQTKPEWQSTSPAENFHHAFQVSPKGASDESIFFELSSYFTDPNDEYGSPQSRITWFSGFSRIGLKLKMWRSLDLNLHDEFYGSDRWIVKDGFVHISCHSRIHTDTLEFSPAPTEGYECPTFGKAELDWQTLASADNMTWVGSSYDVSGGSPYVLKYMKDAKSEWKNLLVFDHSPILGKQAVQDTLWFSTPEQIFAAESNGRAFKVEFTPSTGSSEGQWKEIDLPLDEAKKIPTMVLPQESVE